MDSSYVPKECKPMDLVAELYWLTIVKKLLHIKDEILSKEGLITTASNKLIVWFTQLGKEVDRAYEYLRRIENIQLWINTVSKPYVQPSHAFIDWLLAYGWLSIRDCLTFVEDKNYHFVLVRGDTHDHLFFKWPLISLL